MLLFPQGAVIRLAAPVARGQYLMLINERTNRYVHCRVTDLQTSPDAKSYVEVEFTHTKSDFWGISFPKEAGKAATAAFAPQIPAKPPTDPYVEAPRVVPPKALAAATGAATTTAGAGVPAPALQTAVTVPLNAPTVLPEADEPAFRAPFFLPQPTAATPLSEPVVEQVEAAPVGPRLMKLDLLNIPEPRGNQGYVAAVAAAVLCATILGYRLYSPAEPLPTVPQTPSSPISDSVQPGPGATSAERSVAAAPASVRVVTADVPEIAPVEAPRRLVVLVSKMTVPVHKVASDPHDAPELPAAPSEVPATAIPQLNGEAPGKVVGLLAATGPVLPPPPAPAPVAENTGELADSVAAPRLLVSVQPVYPLQARQAHIEGNVTIEASIDASGNVTGTKVLSGPQVLREAAVKAVATWKFQPARLRNQPTPCNTIVTLRFRLR